MSVLGVIDVRGCSGNTYNFNVYKYGTKFKKIGAVYIILNEYDPFDPFEDLIYVGQSEDMSERFDCHHKEQCFQKHYANYIGIHSESEEDTRLDIEKDIYDEYSPPCND